MSIDVLNEQPLTLNEAARYLPEGTRPNYSTWWRWTTHGVRGVKLETAMIGGRRVTTASAIQKFVEGVTAASTGSIPPARTTRQRDAARRAAERSLDAEGI